MRGVEYANGSVHMHARLFKPYQNFLGRQNCVHNKVSPTRRDGESGQVIQTTY
jgi:hypothetical protein